ncbi:MAG: DNA polymerase-1 [Cellvibrionaceae bacterium]|jgi:DNA polymerase-1
MMKSMQITPLILVDGSSYLYRAYHALPELSTSNGQPTGAVRGVISMLRRLQKDYPDSQIVMIFDAKGKTFRDTLFAQYKAHRPPMPDDLRAQVQPIYDILKAMGLPLLVEAGVEADDVIGTLTKRATAAKQPVVISTGDKDMAQLVDDQVTLINTMTNKFLDRDGVIEKFGIPPELVVDYLALTGDKVDNIPGVPGVGEKTARALIQGLGSLDEIYDNLDAIKELSFRGAKTMADKIRAHEDQARLSYQLATIKTDVALDYSYEQLQVSAADTSALLNLYRELEFKGWMVELESQPENSKTSDNRSADDGDKPDTDKPVNYDVVFTKAVFERWLEKLAQAEYFAVDTETTSLNYMQAQIVGISLAIKPGEAVYIPCAHRYLDAPEQLDIDWVLNRLKPLLEDPNVVKVGQNLKYDRSVLLNHGIQLRGIVFDTMLESYVLNATATRHDMDSLAQFYLNKDTIHYNDIAGKGAKQLSFDQIDIEQAAPYAAEDADITLQLHQKLMPQLSKNTRLQSVFSHIEMPLVPVLSAIERNGALVDAELLGRHSQQLGERLLELEQKAHELAGETFNLDSTKQLGGILFEKLKLPVIKKTPKGSPSTAEAVLHELALDYPLPEVLMEYRVLSKLKSTYADKLPRMINPQTQRVHTSYHQAVTATGRLSSSDPNLQNIPIRTAEGRRIRQAFVAPEGYRIVAADYSQIELRIMAHLSADSGLIEAFKQNLDIHRATAAEVFEVELEQVSSEQRRSAKAINFGLIYGMSAFGLAKQLRIGRNDAQQYINRYFERYPGVQNYMQQTRETAAAQGYVETLSGRRLYLPEINARNSLRRQSAERAAINAPMQGTAADIIKIAMIAVDNWLREEVVDARIIMQVHDELVFEVNSDLVQATMPKLCRLMSEAMDLSVPLLVEAGVGSNWDEAH